MTSLYHPRSDLHPLHRFDWKREEQVAQLKLAYFVARCRIALALYIVAIYDPTTPHPTEAEHVRWGNGYRFELVCAMFLFSPFSNI